MPSESISPDGKTVLTLEADEAAVVCGPDGITLYLHQDLSGPVKSVQNLAATEMAALHGDFDTSTDVPFGGTSGTESN